MKRNFLWQNNLMEKDQIKTQGSFYIVENFLFYKNLPFITILVYILKPILFQLIENI